MSHFSLNIPINSVSFGQVSIAILRELFARGITPPIFPIGPVDVSSQNSDDEFMFKLQNCLNIANSTHQRSQPVFKLWHLSGGMESYSNRQVLLTFYELDSPTKEEINICRNNHTTIVTSEYSKRILEDAGVTNVVCVPLGFDKFNFKVIEKDFFKDDRIVFNLVGKFEKRKHHSKVIQAWIKKYGNNPKFMLQTAVYNQFLSPEQNQQLMAQTIGNNRVENLNLLGPMSHNELYNQFLNSAHIILAMSGGEGFGLPEFHSVALGKHAVVLNAHAYKVWANQENSVMVNPSGKMPAYDGMFFQQGQPFNQGNIFDWEEDAFIAACEEAVVRVNKSKVNRAGLKLQDDFSYAKTVDSILKLLK